MVEEIRRSSLFQGISISYSHVFRSAITTDSWGNIYISDSSNYRIRKMAPDGTVTTVAGSGENGHKDGPALEAHLGECYGIAVGNDGTIYFFDSTNYVIRKLSNGVLYTLAGKPGGYGFMD